MATLDRPVELQAVDAVQPRLARAEVSHFFEMAYNVFSAWFIGGLFLDGFAHSHDMVDNTFFTPWHNVMYSGFAAVGALLVATHLRNILRGYAWTHALPKAYMVSLVGVIIFGIGGGLDMAWHTLLGIERGVEALLSPTHLVLAVGAVLFVSGPLRHAWQSEKRGWYELLPALLSALILLSNFTFLTMYSNIFTQPEVMTMRRPPGNAYAWNATGVAMVIVPAALMMGMILSLVRRFRLPFGSLTLILTANAALMFWIRFRFVNTYWEILLAALIGGLIADLLLRMLRPSVERVTALRIFAFAVPLIFFWLVYGALLLTDGVWWRVHMWAGVPFLAGAIGLGLTYLIAPQATVGSPVGAAEAAQ